MKKELFSKIIPIRHETELVQRFHALLPQDEVLRWQITSKRRDGAATTVELSFDGKKFPFDVIYELKPGFPWLAKLPSHPDEPLLLVTPELSPRVLAYCQDHGISALDLNGRAWLRADGLLVDRPAVAGRNFRHEIEPRNIFDGKSVRIIRSLLTDVARTWTQAELIKRTDASAGLVSRIITHLVGQGYLEKISAREFRLRKNPSLLDAWAKSDSFARRTQTYRYTGFLGSPGELSHLFQKWAIGAGVTVSFTRWIAAWVKCPYTEPVLASAYISRLPDADELKALGLRQVQEGGDLWLHLPDDDGIFLETQEINGLRLTTDAQIYIDLQSTGLRGPDAANALRESDHFCKNK